MKFAHSVFYPLLLASTFCGIVVNAKKTKETLSPTAYPTSVPTFVPTKTPKRKKDDLQSEEFVPETGPFSNPREFVGGQYCKAPNGHQNQDLKHCRLETQRWKELSQMNDITFHSRHLSGECGDTCRPSCVTLMLDLEALSYANDITCKEDEFCYCEHEKCRDCSSEHKL